MTTTLELMAQPKASGPRTVLVVDDDRDIRVMLKTFLATDGFTVLMAEGGDEALELLYRHEVDLLLLDVRMPGMSGIEVCRRIRTDAARARLPVVFLTADGRESDRELEGLEAGGDEFLHKPVSRRALLARVKNLLRLADSDRERSLAAQTSQQEKLASIGQVAAGVAHELNNPLAFVLSNLETLRDYLADLTGVVRAWHAGPGEGQAAEAAVGLEALLADAGPLVDETVEGGRRVRAIVQELKTFARADSDTLEVVDLADVVKSTLLLTEREVLRVATLCKSLEPACVEQASRARLHQLMLNLIVNAMHAVEARAATTGERHAIRVTTRTEGPHAVLEVADTGCGIPRENLEKIFAPYFTTKPLGVGTGLGLSVSRMVVEKLGGTIEVTSTVGVGTTFRVRIPRVRGETAPRELLTSSAA